MGIIEVIFYILVVLYMINTILILVPPLAPFTAIGIYVGIITFTIFDKFVQATY